ncbi:hypothetical protein N2K95_09460 [Arthrobacter zhaoxinii]|uniref:Uncharacterized protein n=1 Tax=Arthrobacter zhaoxinii TaxID=2964616 RepID=A0ABY5YQE0_9MICC|nr:hypothetical protein [Arthrobacter zhaoxinii]UWX95925.1 hypothetical protein N2K95_09460 [Arthrobacter zhaoxinii]
MTLTVADLFPEAEGSERAWIHLGWGSRKETPEHVAARILPTLELLQDRFAVPSVRWQVTVGKTFDLRKEQPVPQDAAALARLVESPRQRDLPDADVSTGTLKARFTLFGGADPESGKLFEFEVEAGRSGPYLGNEITLRLPDGFVFGTPGKLAALFQRLVRIWQPETAALESRETLRAVWKRCDELGVRRSDPRLGYMNWFSLTGYGRPPFPLDARVRAFPDGTLICAQSWNAGSVADLYADLQVMGMMHDMPAVQVLAPPPTDDEQPHTDLKEHRGGN